MPNPNQRVPPPCWTPEETHALILAYRDRWFSSNRGSLRYADWSAIAQSLSSSSSAGKPPKSPLQCQHKVEKLRRRYRDEKRRLLQDPRRFSSSWDLFPLLDSMEIGSFGSSNSGPVMGLDPDPELAFRTRKDSRCVIKHHSEDNIGNGFSGKLNLKASNGRNSNDIEAYGSFLVNSRIEDRCKKVNGRSYSPPASVGNGHDNVEIDSVGPVEELAQAISVSVESFVKVEQMKMEVVAEMERMRMEMELQRNKMMLDLHVKVVDSIAKSLLDFNRTGKKRRKRKPVELVSCDFDSNGGSHAVGIGCEGIHGGCNGVVEETS